MSRTFWILKTRDPQEDSIYATIGLIFAFLLLDFVIFGIINNLLTQLGTVTLSEITESLKKYIFAW